MPKIREKKVKPYKYKQRSKAETARGSQARSAHEEPRWDVWDDVFHALIDRCAEKYCKAKAFLILISRKGSDFPWCAPAYLIVPQHMKKEQMSKKEQQADGRARTVEIYNAATWADV